MPGPASTVIGIVTPARGDELVVTGERREREPLARADVDAEAAGGRAGEEDASGTVVGDRHVVGRVAAGDQGLVDAGVAVVGVGAVAVVPDHDVVAVATVDVVVAGEAGDAVVAVAAEDVVVVGTGHDDVVARAGVDRQRPGRRGQRLGPGHRRVEVGRVGEAGGRAEVVLEEPRVGADDDGVGSTVAGERRGRAADGAGHGRAGRAGHREGRRRRRRRPARRYAGRSSFQSASFLLRRVWVAWEDALARPPFPGVASRTERAGGISPRARRRRGVTTL